MKIVTCIAVAVLAVALLSGGAMAANEFNVWFGDAAGNQISSMDVAPGAAFDVYVYMSSTLQSFTWDVAVGYDQSTTDGPSAVPTLNKIGLATGDAANDLVWGDIATKGFDTEMSKAIVGFTGTGTRPYGADFSRARIQTGFADPFAQSLVATMHLKNNMAEGDSQDVVIYDAGKSDTGTTMFMDSNFNVYRGVTGTLKVNSGAVVPEPGSLLALACGVMGLAGFAIRRRK